MMSILMTDWGERFSICLDFEGVGKEFIVVVFNVLLLYSLGMSEGTASVV
jgi:hypothetical protein